MIPVATRWPASFHWQSLSVMVHGRAYAYLLAVDVDEL
jgi:hypothetical protein